MAEKDRDIVPQVEISFSSLSVSPTDKSLRAFSRQQTTDVMIANMCALHARINEETGIDTSVSLHVGDLTDVSRAGRGFQTNNIRITSLDRPDVYPLGRFVKDVTAQVKRDYRNIPTQVGRRLHNVGTVQSAEKKNRAGLRVIHQQMQRSSDPVILRTHSGLWIENNGKEGDRLRRSLQGKDVVLAVEINGYLQSQQAYRELIEQLAKENTRTTPVTFDLDLGHLAEAEYRQRAVSEGKSPLAFYEDVVREQGDLLSVTSLNQYRDGDTVTHQNFSHPDGRVDHMQVATTLGRGVEEGRIASRQMTVVEFMPFDYPVFLRKEGVVFTRNFHTAFMQAAIRSQTAIIPNR